jgi:hypothetical protein
VQGYNYANVLFACRNLCFLVAVDIWRLCAGGIIVLVLPATGNDLAAEIASDGRLSHIENLTEISEWYWDSNCTRGRVKFRLGIICCIKFLLRLYMRNDNVAVTTLACCRTG